MLLSIYIYSILCLIIASTTQQIYKYTSNKSRKKKNFVYARGQGAHENNKNQTRIDIHNENY